MCFFCTLNLIVGERYEWVMCIGLDLSLAAYFFLSVLADQRGGGGGGGSYARVPLIKKAEANKVNNVIWRKILPCIFKKKIILQNKINDRLGNIMEKEYHSKIMQEATELHYYNNTLKPQDSFGRFVIFFF